MHINVNIYAQLRYYLPDLDQSLLEKVWNVPRDAKVCEIIGRLGLPKEVRIAVLVNNNSVDQETVLKEGDIIHILPQMVGG